MMMMNLRRQLNRCSFLTQCVIVLVLWWTSMYFLTLSYNHEKEYLHDTKVDSYTLGLDSNVSVSLVERERTLVTIVCNTKRNPDQLQRNLFQRQLNQVKTMLKSLVYFSSSSFRVIVITDTRDTFKSVLKQIQDWPNGYRSRLQLERAPRWLPKEAVLLMESWRPCSWPKLFLHEALPQLDAAVYVDTDILFLGPADNLWNILEGLKHSQAFAMGPEPFYDKYKHRKYAGTVGLSAGLMAVNFTRLRSFSSQYGDFTSTVMHYKNAFTNTHDQDTLNALLSDYPDMFYEMSPQWMFCPSQCLKGVLPCCLETGINVLHGYDAVFVRGIEMTFQVIYEVMLNFHLGSQAIALRDALENEFFRVDRLTLSSKCNKISGIQGILTKHIRDLAAAEERLKNNNSSVTEWYKRTE